MSIETTARSRYPMYMAPERGKPPMSSRRVPPPISRSLTGTQCQKVLYFRPAVVVMVVLPPPSSSAQPTLWWLVKKQNGPRDGPPWAIAVV